jgi:hypothetical protein
MRKTSFLLLSGLIGLALACSDRSSTSTNIVQRGIWGSSKASLTIKDSSATLQILADGNCYGSYGQIDQPIASGRFDLSGTYTQLMGVYPGKMEYPAQYSGTVAGTQMALTVTVPALQVTFGPFNLAYGINSAWTPCLYP